MSKRSVFILTATGFVLVAMMVLLLVPAPVANTAAVEQIVARLEGALGILVPACTHTLLTDRGTTAMRVDESER